ncbi:non-ribosomal peptide synthetase [Streptomyces acidiscabies]|uniref:non-ribosomal peptide synthetase n=1 Tax=Streptomyces acidiscabies TaxID=42234 RepID=UPI00073E86FC|nr:non-ribosomal peptide synthetase [Streptomyces acidiscabies]GAQ51163.1 dimodular nonribosomal peptide synthase [Streptomyces acidiscabies]
MNKDRVEQLRRRVALRTTPVREPSGVARAGSLTEAFAAAVQAYGDRVAVRCGRQSLTYRQLDERAAELAGALQALGVDPARPVGILLERSADMVAAALAVLRVGCCYVPLDPATPRARLDVILQDADPAVVITSGELAALPGERAILRVDVSLPAGELGTSPAGRDSRAYVIFTSGTTGRPKGVQVTHGNVLRLFSSSEEHYGFGPEDVWSLFHSFAFDVSVWEMWGALLYGGTLVVVPKATAQDPVAFRALLREERVTVLSQTPTAFNQLAAEDVRHPERLPLRWVVFGGEALHFSDLKRWADKYGDDAPALVNMYGITETTVHASFRRVRRADLDRGLSLIGRPLPDLEFLLLDEDLAPVPAGETGEIVVTGPGVALGYLGRPDLTRERFVELPGGRGRGYRSGDLARLLPDGEFAYHGRRDDQVKIRGFRIELGEVEGALRALEGVTEAAVVARELPRLGRALVAYVVPDGPGAAPAGLRGRLSEVLPEYMLPSVFVPLDALPLTHNGKLDRRALPDPTPDDHTAPADDTDRDPVVARIVAAMSDLLPGGRITPTDGFFDLGGHSLLATRLLARVRTDFGVSVALRDFLREPTARALAAAVREREPDGGPVVPLLRAPDQERRPATSAQQRLYFLSRMEPDSSAYNLHMSLLLEGELDVAALERAFVALADRHVPLRSLLRLEEGEVVAVALPAERVRVSVEEAPGGEVRRVIEELAEEEVARPFDLERDLPLRVRVVAFGEGVHGLLVTLHHVAGDGWSNAVLGRELGVLYAHFARRTEGDPLPALAATYADYAHSMREWLGTPAARDDVDYWEGRLADLPAEHSLPLDRVRPERMTYHGDTVTRRAGGALKQAARSADVTVFMLLQAAFALFVARRGKDADVVIGTPVANRPSTDFDDVIGMFVNTVVLRTRVPGTGSVGDLLAQVRDQTLRDLERQHVPFEELVRRLNPERTARHSPLFQLMLVVQNNETVPLSLDGLTVTAVRLPGQEAKTDLVLDVTEDQDGFRLNWRYNTDLFDRGTVEGMAAEFTELLNRITGDPHTPLGELLTSPAREVPHVLLPLRTRPDGPPPVFAFPGILGLAPSYAQLSAHFPERSFHALSTGELVRAHGDGLTVPVLAEACARAIAAEASGRPVHLVGHSFGGALAYEVARRLGGGQVLSLVLLDALAPKALRIELSEPREKLLAYFLGSLSAAFPAVGQEHAAAVREELAALPEAEVLDRAERRMGEAAELLGGSLRDAFADYVRLAALDWPASGDLSGVPVLLVEATRNTGRGDLTADWAAVLNTSIRCESIATDHEGLLRGPAAETLSELMHRFHTPHDAVKGHRPR